jgi:hypothetical protein
MLRDGVGGPQGLVAAQEALTKSCSLGDQAACNIGKFQQ